MKTVIVGLSGKKQSGKDTFAKYLVKYCGFTRVSFAEPVKKCLYILNPWVKADDGCTTLRYQVIIDALGEDSAKESYAEVRRLQQVFGTEVVREEFGDNFWIDLAFKRISEQNLKKVVVSDVRFKNELAAIRDIDGSLLIKINRDKCSAVKDKHVSESGLPDACFDYVVDNNTAIEDLDEKAREIMWKYENSCKV